MKIGNVNNASQMNVSIPKGDHVTKTTNVTGSSTPKVEVANEHKVEPEESTKIPSQSNSDFNDTKFEDPANLVEDDVLQESVNQANKTLKIYDRKIERSIHEVTNNVIYTLKDTKTNEVIKEFPSRKIQDMLAKMWELAGLVIDDRA